MLKSGNLSLRSTYSVFVSMAKHIYTLEKSYTLTIGDSFRALEKDVDVIKQLLRDTRSDGTRRNYEKDLRDFFNYCTGKEPSRDTVLEFLHLTQAQAVALVLNFKAYVMNERKLSENSVNRKLAAIKSMVAMGRKLGVCAFVLSDVKSETVQKYRDTSGIEASEFAKVLALVDRTTLKGKRDYAILRLLWDNALRRNEVCALDVEDFNPQACTLTIYGKGTGTQKTVIELTHKTVEAIKDWIIASKKGDQTYQPLFGSLSPRKGEIEDRLIGESIRRLVVKLCKQAGISKRMSPHRVRHSSITTALDHSNGNYRKVQNLSRHANIDTIQKYDDNRKRQQQQREISDVLADLV
jgi:integrase/recombinase XerC